MKNTRSHCRFVMTLFCGVAILHATIAAATAQSKTPPIILPSLGEQQTPSKTPAEITRYYSPDDPNIERLLQYRDQVAKETEDSDDAAARKLVMEADNNLVKYFYDSRQAELARLRPAADAVKTRPNLHVMNFPELDGSTSCSNFGMIVVCRGLDVLYQWENMSNVLEYWHYFNRTPSMSRSPNPVYFDPATRRRSEAQFVKFQTHPAAGPYGYRFDAVMQSCFGNFQGTHGSYMSLIGLPKNPDGSEIIPEIPKRENHLAAASYIPPILTAEHLFPPSEILLVARKPSADELEAARQARVELDVRPVALDAFVFLVNRKNPVRSLTLNQVREIYGHCEKGESGVTPSRSGANALSWSRYGGPNEEIMVFERGFNSGSREIMDELVMNLPVNDPAVAERIAENRQRRFDPVFDSMAGPYLALVGWHSGSENTWGIAYSVYNYEHFLACTPEVRVLEINGVRPGYDTIADGSYPLVSEVYVVTRKGIPADSPAAILRDWLLSDDGQRVVRESGYVPVNEKLR